jgi:hypothetical protein
MNQDNAKNVTLVQLLHNPNVPWGCAIIMFRLYINQGPKHHISTPNNLLGSHKEPFFFF